MLMLVSSPYPSSHLRKLPPDLFVFTSDPWLPAWQGLAPPRGSGSCMWNSGYHHSNSLIMVLLWWIKLVCINIHGHNAIIQSSFSWIMDMKHAFRDRRRDGKERSAATFCWMERPSIFHRLRSRLDPSFGVLHGTTPDLLKGPFKSNPWAKISGALALLSVLQYMLYHIYIYIIYSINPK